MPVRPPAGIVTTTRFSSLVFLISSNFSLRVTSKIPIYFNNCFYLVFNFYFIFLLNLNLFLLIFNYNRSIPFTNWQREIYNVIDIINIKLINYGGYHMPKYSKADQFFYPHGVRRGGFSELNDGKFGKHVDQST